MNLIPPSFKFEGNKEKSISLKAQAAQFYNLVTTQAAKEGLGFINRTKVLSDGSVINVYSQLNSNYNNWSGVARVITAAGKLFPGLLRNIHVAYKKQLFANKAVLFINSLVSTFKDPFSVRANYWIGTDEFGNKVAVDWEVDEIAINGYFTQPELEFSNEAIIAASYNKIANHIITITRRSNSFIKLKVFKIPEKIVSNFFPITQLVSRSITPFDTTAEIKHQFLINPREFLKIITDFSGDPNIPDVSYYNQTVSKNIISQDYLSETSNIISNTGWPMIDFTSNYSTSFDNSVPNIYTQNGSYSELGTLLSSNRNNTIYNSFIDNQILFIKYNLVLSDHSYSTNYNIESNTTTNIRTLDITSNGHSKYTISYDASKLVGNSIISIEPLLPNTAYEKTDSIIFSEVDSLSPLIVTSLDVTASSEINSTFIHPIYYNNIIDIFVYLQIEETINRTLTGIITGSAEPQVERTLIINRSEIFKVKYKGVTSTIFTNTTPEVNTTTTQLFFNELPFFQGRNYNQPTLFPINEGSFGNSSSSSKELFIQEYQSSYSFDGRFLLVANLIELGQPINATSGFLAIAIDTSKPALTYTTIPYTEFPSNYSDLLFTVTQLDSV